MDERLIEASTATTEDMAKAQHPLLDTSKPAASEETPSGETDVRAAQTAEEVEAQYVNRAGGPEPTQEGDANADDEANAAESDSGITPDEAADMTDKDPDGDAPFAAPAPAPAADRDADADAGDAGPVLDIEGDDTADGGDVTGR